VIGDRGRADQGEDLAMKRLAAALVLAMSPTVAAAPPPVPGGTAAPGATAAAEPAPLPSPPGATAPWPPPRNPDEYEASWSVQVVFGALAGAAGAIGGGYLGYQLECHDEPCQDWEGFGGLLLGGSLGLTLGTTAAVFATGQDGDHDTSVGLTWLGTLVGGTVGVLAASQITDAGWFPATVVVTTSTAFGGTLLNRASRTRKKPATALRLVPFTGGNSVGLTIVGSTF
jgi:hypothetical protein